MKLSDIAEVLKKYNKKKILFVGLGNSLRGDDAAGLEIVKQLNKSDLFRDSMFIQAGTNPENYVLTISEMHPSAVVFADAARWGGKPGELKIFSSGELSDTGFSTHTYSIKLIEAFLLNLLSADFYYLCIQPFATKLNTKLSSCVDDGIKNFIGV